MQSEDQLAKRIIQIVAAFWILMKAMCFKLWITNRNYPLVPVVDLPGWLHLLLYVLFFLLAGWLLFKPFSKTVLLMLIVIETVSILGDQNRLQPWQYQYLFTFLAIAGNLKSRAKALQAIALIMVSTYLFSGLQKLNSGFIDNIWSVHFMKRFFRLPDYIVMNQFARKAGYIIPFIEIAGAIGLLFRKYMKTAAWILIDMHIFLLLFLGPLGINYNSVVWPWNVIMMILLYLLFIKHQVLLRPSLYISKANVVISFCWIALPFAGLFYYWDKFLSSGMYSGRGRLVQFYFEDRAKIPEELKPYAFYSKTNNSGRIVLTDWCMQELNVASVTEPRVLKSIVQQLNDRYTSTGLTFVLTPTKY